MTLGFIETANVMQYRDNYFGTDSVYSDVQQALLSNPQLGPVMRGCGGLRIIYLHLPDIQRIVFLDVYDKDEVDDLTPEQRKELAADAEKIRLEFQDQNFFWPGG